MAGNTIMTAKNSFSEGLIMDFAPDNTNANSLTSALNATLLTFNGNEMSLQNDMGNGRVETAYLPDGYIPVGTCEFGDIIYIVSYNPLIDKAQIGCFPSPERNISSEELHTPEVSLKAEEFQEMESVTFENGTSGTRPTGKIKTTAVKKVLFQNNLHPGDQYIISAKNLNGSYLSDFGNEDHLKGEFPKLWKINVVSIEDSGKINYLDSNVKWYNNDYYIQQSAQSSTGSIDIDEYRTLVSSAYNTYSSKVSGKLALLVELEKINSFDCTWEVYAIPEALQCYKRTTYTDCTNLMLDFNITSKTDDSDLIHPYDYVCYINKDAKMREVITNGRLITNQTIDEIYTKGNAVLYNIKPAITVYTCPTERLGQQSSVEFKEDGDLITFNDANGIKRLLIKTSHTQGDYTLYIPCLQYNQDEIKKDSEETNSHEFLISQYKETLDYLKCSESQYIYFCLQNIKHEINAGAFVRSYAMLLTKNDSEIVPSEATNIQIDKLYFILTRNCIKTSDNFIWVAVNSANISIDSEILIGTDENDNQYYGKSYQIYFNCNWSGDHYDINPSCIIVKNEWDTSIFKDILPLFDKQCLQLTRSYLPELDTYSDYKKHCYNKQVMTYLNTSIKSRTYEDDGTLIEGKYKTNLGLIDINDDVVNNYFKYPVTKYFSTFNIPNKLIKKEIQNEQSVEVVQSLTSDKLIYNYTLTPAMPYGKLDDLAVSGYIDFNKIGTNYFDLTQWRYYNYDNTIQLTLGLETYTEPNRKVQEVIIEFYDNQGLAAAYHLNNKNSYSGQFSDILTLNSKDTKLNAINKDGVEQTHPGILVNDPGENPEEKYVKIEQTDDQGNIISTTWYENDAGVLHSNWLYLAKIYIKSSYVDSNGIYLGNADYKVFERWVWTNTLFNEYYYNTLDFVDLKPSLAFDVGGSYSTVEDKWDWQSFTYDTTFKNQGSLSYQNLSANVECINQTSNDVNVNLKLEVGLYNTHNTFALNAANVDRINIQIYEGDDNLKTYPEQPVIKYYSGEFGSLESIYPTIDENLSGTVDLNNVGKRFATLLGTDSQSDKELYSGENNYQYYKDTAKLVFANEKWDVPITLSVVQDGILNKSFAVSKTKQNKAIPSTGVDTEINSGSSDLEESFKQEGGYGIGENLGSIDSIKPGDFELADNDVVCLKYDSVSTWLEIPKKLEELGVNSSYQLPNIYTEGKPNEDWYYINSALKNWLSETELPYVLFGYSTDEEKIYVYDYSNNYYKNKINNFKIHIEEGVYLIDIPESVNLYKITETNRYLIKESKFKQTKSEDVTFEIVGECESLTLRKLLDQSSTKDEIVYLNLDNELKTINTTSYNYTLSDLLGTKLDLIFSAIKFSKYLTQYSSYTPNGQNISVLKSFIYEKSDLEKYNLALVPAPGYNNEYIPYFRRGIFIGLTNVVGEDTRYNMGRLNFIKTGSDIEQLTTIKPEEFSRHGQIEARQAYQSRTLGNGNGDKDIPYQTILTRDVIFQYDVNKDLRNQLFVPITFGYSVDEDKNERYKTVTRDNTFTVWYYWDGKDYSTADPVQLGGSLAFLNNSKIYIEDNWINNNVYENSRKVFTYLRHLFYLTDETSDNSDENTYTYASNYAYLDGDYSLYTKDVIVKVAELESFTDSLLMQGIPIKDYVSVIKGTDTSNLNNVDFQSKGIIKNIPFQVIMNYVKPSLNVASDEDQGILVRSTVPTIPQYIKQDLKRNVLYVFNKDSNVFDSITQVDKIYMFENERFTISDNDVISSTCQESSSQEQLKIGNLKNCLSYTNNTLVAKSQLNTTEKTYKINFTNHNKEKRGLSNFENNLKFFE